MMADHLPHKRCAHFEQVPSGDWGKVIFYGLPHQMKQVARFIDSLENRQVNFIASSISTYEMLAEGCAQGHGGQGIKRNAGDPLRSHGGDWRLF